MSCHVGSQVVSNFSTPIHKYKFLWDGDQGVRTEVQVLKKKFHTHIHLNYVRIEFLA